MKKTAGSNIVARNKIALFDYFIQETFEAGLSLEGCEVKSIRAGKCSIKEAFISFENGEAFIKQMNVTPYENEYNFNKVDPYRVRKLLLHKSEIRMLEQFVEEKGNTVVPLDIHVSGQFIKLNIAIAKGKKNYDKRASIAERDANRTMERALKSYNKL